MKLSIDEDFDLTSQRLCAQIDMQCDIELERGQNLVKRALAEIQFAISFARKSRAQKKRHERVRLLQLKERSAS